MHVVDGIHGDVPCEIQSTVAATDDLRTSSVPDGRASDPPSTGPGRPQQQRRWSAIRASFKPRRTSSVSEEEFVAPTEELLFLEVRPPVFAAIWWAMVAVHTVCASLLSIQMKLYIYLTDPYMTYYVSLIRPGVVSIYTAVAIVFGVIAVMHWSVVLKLVYYSLSQRKYAFYPANHYDSKPSHRVEPIVGPVSKWQRFQTRLASLRLSIWGRRGLLGVESRYFYPYFYVRETIELTSQIYQAYRGSLLVARPWINHLSVSVIVLNCLLTTLLQMAYKKHPEVRRIALLSLDATLDFVVAMVIPTSIFMPYFRLFDGDTQSFPLENLYDEKWFVNAVLENQEFFIVSVTDLVFKCIPHLSITTCLKKVRALLHKDTSVDRGALVFSSVIAPSQRRHLQQQKLQRIYHRAEKLKLRKLATATPPKAPERLLQEAAGGASRKIRKYANKLIRVVLLGIACAVLTIHLQAVHTSYKPHSAGCRQAMRPWFAPAFACSIFEINCRRLNITGSNSEIATTLEHLFPAAVAALVFDNCPALEMPPQLQNFPHLLRLDVYNSSIVSWDAQAALTETAHPLLASVSLVRVSFAHGQLPEGLMSASFPEALRSIEITTTNLVSLPDDLHKHWHHAMTRVCVENSLLTVVPPTIQAMVVEKLSLDGNAIASIDPAWLRDYTHQYFVVGLAHNPLTALPEDVHTSTSLRYLRLQGTNLTALPGWIQDAKERVHDLTQVFVSGTPFCASVDPVQYGAMATISCAVGNATIMANDPSGLFPLELVDRKRAASDLSPEDV